MPVTSRPSRTRSVSPLSAASVVLPSKHSPGPVAVHGLEVVEAPHAVEAELLGEARPRRDLRPRHPLLRDVESELHAGRAITPRDAVPAATVAACGSPCCPTFTATRSRSTRCSPTSTRPAASTSTGCSATSWRWATTRSACSNGIARAARGVGAPRQHRPLRPHRRAAAAVARRRRRRSRARARRRRGRGIVRLDRGPPRGHHLDRLAARPARRSSGARSPTARACSRCTRRRAPTTAPASTRARPTPSRPRCSPAATPTSCSAATRTGPSIGASAACARSTSAASAIRSRPTCARRT